MEQYSNCIVSYNNLLQHNDQKYDKKINNNFFKKIKKICVTMLN